MLTNPRKPSVRELQGTNFGAQNMKMGCMYSTRRTWNDSLPPFCVPRLLSHTPKPQPLSPHTHIP